MVQMTADEIFAQESELVRTYGMSSSLIVVDVTANLWTK